MIDAVELKERFLAVFGPVSGEAIFKEMALLVPSVAKKGALLSLCENVSLFSWLLGVSNVVQPSCTLFKTRWSQTQITVALRA